MTCNQTPVLACLSLIPFMPHCCIQQILSAHNRNHCRRNVSGLAPVFLEQLVKPHVPEGAGGQGREVRGSNQHLPTTCTQMRSGHYNDLVTQRDVGSSCTRATPRHEH